MGLAVAVAVAEAEAVSRVWERQPQLSAGRQVLQAAGASVGRVVGSVESMEAWKPGSEGLMPLAPSPCDCGLLVHEVK